MSRKPIYKKCHLYKTMDCNPNACGQYEECKKHRIFLMSSAVIYILTFADNIIGLNDNNEPF